jgi:hypothetical protein
MITQLEEENMSMEQAQLEGKKLIQEEITMHTVEALTDKVAQMRTKGKELTNNFHILEKEVQGAHTT